MYLTVYVFDTLFFFYQYYNNNQFAPLFRAIDMIYTNYILTILFNMT